MTSPEFIALKGRLMETLNKNYMGSSDLEKCDSVDFCSYFEKNYGGDEGKARLKDMFLKLERDMRVLGWAPPETIVIQAAPDPDDVPEFWVTPWLLGLTSDHSVKGQSKLVHIMDIVDGFLRRPYNSKTEPLQVIFGPRSKVQEPVEDWSMVLVVGMGKASACRMILEGIASLNLAADELAVLAPTIKSLLRMRCTYDPAQTEELQFQRAMCVKNQATERPRPDALMWAARWFILIAKEGLDFAEVIDDRIKQFNTIRSEGFGILAYEVVFIKAYRYQSNTFVDMLAQHWQNFKVNESAVPPKRLALADLSPETKDIRCEKKNALWSKVLTWSQEANVVWLMRETGVFLKSIKEAQRAGKKINLRTNSKQYRMKADNIHTHDEVCLFVYFVPEFKKHTADAQFDDLMSRMTKGYFDKELNEKVRIMDEGLTVHDFRFLSMITGKCAVQGPRSDQILNVEVAAETAELNLFKAKLSREGAMWANFQRDKKLHDITVKDSKRSALKELHETVRVRSDTICNVCAPCKRLNEDGVVPYIADAISNWAETEKLSKERVYTMLVVRFDSLGSKFSGNANPVVRIVSDLIAKDPVRTAAIFLAPNTGKDDVYNESSVRLSVETVEELLRQDQWAPPEGLRVCRGALNLDETTMKKSGRPGFTTVFLVTSPEREDTKLKPFVSKFEKSYLFTRLKAIVDVPVLAADECINPCASITRSSQGMSALSKAQRSKQWNTGVGYWDAVRGAALKNTGLTSQDGVAWVDLFPYDDKLQHSVLQAYGQQSASVPAQAVVSPIWAKMGVEGPANTEKVDNRRVESFISKSQRSFVELSIKEKRMIISDLNIGAGTNGLGAGPTYAPEAYVQTCPNAAGFLPVRQDVLDAMGSKVKLEAVTAELDKAVAEHNKVHNPSCVPYKGEKRSAVQGPRSDEAEGGTAKVYPPDPKGPKSKEEFDPTMVFPGNDTDHELLVKDGCLYVHALQDCIVSAQQPLVNIWGEYLCGSDKKKDIAKHKAKHYMWEVNSMDLTATFETLGKGQVTPFENSDIATFSKFHEHLEEMGHVSVNVTAHELKEVSNDVDGQPVTQFEISVVDECLFLAKSLPPRTKPLKGNAGSLMNFNEWNFKEGTHNMGRVLLVPAMAYDVLTNSVVPRKCGIALTSPIKAMKGDVVLLG